MSLRDTCLRGLTRQENWKTSTLCFSFWSLNVGLALMVLLSLLPIGLMQTCEPRTPYSSRM